MPARRLLLHALLGPALAGVPGAMAWAPGFPPVELRAGAPVTLDASVPGGRGSTRNVALASGEGHTIALVGAADLRRSNLVEVGIGKPARLITSFPLGARNPTVGTDRTGKVVVLVRACSGGREATSRPTAGSRSSICGRASPTRSSEARTATSRRWTTAPSSARRARTSS